MFSSQLCHHTEVQRTAQRASGGGYQVDRQSILRKGSRTGFATRNDLYTALALTVRDRCFATAYTPMTSTFCDRIKVFSFPASTSKKKKAHCRWSFFVLFNADYENVLLHLGGRARDLNWELMLDTSASHMESQTLEHLDKLPAKKDDRSRCCVQNFLRARKLDKMIIHEHNFPRRGSIPLTRLTHR
jgi:hypothetical protein